ncbi:MAG: methyltransferase domain-containing protein [Campylobacterota bacterium]|nr:methyltransferase domain-containing protein [Campylobacterota bacterium]
MTEDKQRWNIRHVKKPMRHKVSDILKGYIEHSKVGDALDLACGTGRNTHFLDELGFMVDAVDLSDYALSQIRDTKNINKIEVDLDFYDLQKNSYDLIVNTNYLNRRLMQQMQESLKKDGLLIFETFIQAHTKPEQGSMNPDYLLQSNELLDVFKELEIIYYEEKDGINLRGEENKTASLVARK